jgi:dihydrofolate reductase
VRLVTTTQITLDGVMQGLGGAGEDTRGGFARGGWSLPLGDPEVGERIVAAYSGARAFLFGRWTYQLFAGYWGTLPDAERHPIAAPLNARPKYLVSRTLTAGTWPATTVLSGDVAAAVRALRDDGDDGVLLVPGSGTLVRWLLAHDLVDEVELLVYPVVVGQGTRLFPAEGPDLALDLVRAQSTSGGTQVLTYRPAGRPTYAP